MVAIFMISAKLAILSLLRITLFWKKGYDVIISDHDATKKDLSRDSIYTVNVVKREVIINSIL